MQPFDAYRILMDRRALGQTQQVATCVCGHLPSDDCLLWRWNNRAVLDLDGLWTRLPIEDNRDRGGCRLFDDGIHQESLTVGSDHVRDAVAALQRHDITYSRGE